MIVVDASALLEDLAGQNSRNELDPGAVAGAAVTDSWHPQAMGLVLS